MLNFETVFTKGYSITDDDIPTLMQCTNIKYSHTNWTYGIFRDIKVVQHVVDNIVDVNDPEYGSDMCTLLYNILCLNYINCTRDHSNVKYILNNGYINKDTISRINNCSGRLLQSSIISSNISTVGKLIDYLTDVSLDKFTRFNNVEKYYYMIHTMLLIMKKQHLVPPRIVKHLIIPFVYQ